MRLSNGVFNLGVLVILITIVLLPVVVMADSPIPLSKGVYNGTLSKATITDEGILYNATSIKMSVSSQVQAVEVVDQKPVEKTEYASKYTYTENTLKETITIEKDMVLSFPITLSPGSKMIPWYNGQWKIVNATNGNTMDGIVAEKPFGIDAAGNRIEMDYSYDKGALNLNYNRTIVTYIQTDPFKMDSWTPIFSEITYPLLIDPTWTNTGGCWTTTYGGWTVVMWNTTGSATFSLPELNGSAVEYLIIAGAGGGGADTGGGGGAGGVLNGTNASWTTGTTLTINMGAGGAGGTYRNASSDGHGQNGTNSSINTYQALGGGGAGSAGWDTASYKNATGKNGGSGGGSAFQYSNYSNLSKVGAGYSTQGNQGGNATLGSFNDGFGDSTTTGGGGGWGAVGGNASLPTTTGNGGDGKQNNITGLLTWYAGGGGGSNYAGNTPMTGGTGGQGGGGAGSGYKNTNGVSGTNGLGGGGGGATTGDSPGNAGSGGSGIVIIKYALTTFAPTVSTQPATSITNTTATGNGNLNNTGQPNSTTRGIAYSYTNPTPTTSDSIVYETGIFANGSFSEPLVSLLPETQYYTRAYATNTIGTSYGAVQGFNTTNPPTVSTQAVDNISLLSATGHGTIVTAGFPLSTTRGICINVSVNPTVANTCFNETGSFGAGAFSKNLVGLSIGTTYHVRAFAINTQGTAYGGDQVFATLPGAPVASFTVSNTSGMDPLLVNFTDTSTSTPTTWLWNYSQLGGSGPVTFSTSQNPQYSFITARTGGMAVANYSISLYVANSNSSSQSSQITWINVTWLGGPVASFYGTPTTGSPGVLVYFTDMSTKGEPGGLTYNWSFGDAYSTTPYSTTQGNVSHVYGVAGTYDVNLTLVNNNGTSSMLKSQYIIVSTSQSQTQQVQYTPKQTTFRVLDKNDNPIIGAQVNATFNQSTLPSTAITWLVSNYGMNTEAANEAMNGTLIMSGITDSTGAITYTMQSSFGYDVNVIYQGTLYHFMVSGRDNYYLLRISSGAYTSPEDTYNSYANTTNSTLTFSEPDVNNITMGIDYYDASGLTDNLIFTIKLLSNNTVMYTTSQPIAGATRVIINQTYPNIRGQQWQWYYDAHRTV
jgi:PKD repeat protein